MRALTVQPDGTIELSDAIEEGGHVAYEWLRSQVGGSICPIDLEPPEPAPIIACMYVHDEGKLIGLERNPAAERLANHFGAIFHGDWIAGPVAIVGFDPSEGESVELPAEVAERALFLMLGPEQPPLRVAPTYWQEVAEFVARGVPVITVEPIAPPEPEEAA